MFAGGSDVAGGGGEGAAGGGGVGVVVSPFERPGAPEDAPEPAAAVEAAVDEAAPDEEARDEAALDGEGRDEEVRDEVELDGEVPDEADFNEAGGALAEPEAGDGAAPALYDGAADDGAAVDGAADAAAMDAMPMVEAPAVDTGAIDAGAMDAGAMEEADEAPLASTVCPHLSLRDDPATAAVYAREDHVCMRHGAAASIHARYQTTFCIGEKYRSCQVFAGKRERPPSAPRTWAGLGQRVWGAAALPSTPLQWALLGVFVVLVPAVLGTVVALTGGDDDSGPVAAATEGQESQGGEGGAPALDLGEGASVGVAGEGLGDVEAPVTAGEDGAEAAEGAAVVEESLTPLEQLEAWPDVQEWIVQDGDSLLAIAREFGTTVEAIALFNLLEDPGAIFKGQVLDVPVGFVLDLPEPEIAEEPAVVAEPPADVPVEDPAPAEPVDEFGEAIASLPPAVVEAVLAWPNVQAWTVEEGDTLLALALAFETSVEAIAVLNGLTNSNQIGIGDVLQVPVGFSAEGVVPAPVEEGPVEEEVPPVEEGPPVEEAPVEEPPVEGEGGGEGDGGGGGEPAPEGGA